MAKTQKMVSWQKLLDSENLTEYELLTFIVNESLKPISRFNGLFLPCPKEYRKNKSDLVKLDKENLRFILSWKNFDSSILLRIDHRFNKTAKRFLGQQTNIKELYEYLKENAVFREKDVLNLFSDKKPLGEKTSPRPKG